MTGLCLANTHPTGVAAKVRAGQVSVLKTSSARRAGPLGESRGEVRAVGGGSEPWVIGPEDTTFARRARTWAEHVALPQPVRLRAAHSGGTGRRPQRPARPGRPRGLAQAEAPGNPWQVSGDSASGGSARSSRRGASAVAAR